MILEVLEKSVDNSVDGGLWLVEIVENLEDDSFELKVDGSVDVWWLVKTVEGMADLLSFGVVLNDSVDVILECILVRGVVNDVIVG